MLLWGAAIEDGRACQTWLTFKQALALGGNVRKGERGTMVVYADTFVPKNEQARAAGKDGKETVRGIVSRPNGEDARRVGFLKRYTVFNVDQCEGLPASVYAGRAPLPEREAVPHAEALIKATGADSRIGGDKAFYVPSKDFIQVPPQPALKLPVVSAL